MNNRNMLAVSQLKEHIRRSNICLEIHIGDEIRKQLNIKKRSVNWLADEMGCDQSNLNKKLKKPHLDYPLLHHISEVLDVDFFALYSLSLSEKKEK